MKSHKKIKIPYLFPYVQIAMFSLFFGLSISANLLPDTNVFVYYIGYAAIILLAIMFLLRNHAETINYLIISYFFPHITARAEKREIEERIMWERLHKQLANSLNSRLIPKNEFKLLGLNENASIEDIKKRYKILAVKFHPDKGGSQADFIKITNARDICIKYKNSVK